jgi:hypothetical protein
MAAIITEQFRVLSASNFVSGISSTDSSYYTWVGLPNAVNLDANWNTNPPAPIDSINDENRYWDTMLAMKKINSSDVRRVVEKYTWASGEKYDMYRNDYGRNNLAPVSKSTTLYNSKYYVINKDFRVYICLDNGISPENPTGKPSLDQPLFTDLEPRAAGSSGDDYVWKYLYTLTASDILRFDSTNFIPVPDDWSSNSDNAPVRDNSSTSGQIKVVTVTNRGVGYGTALTYSNVDIFGDGEGAKASVTVNADGKIQTVDVSTGGSGYSFGTLDLDGAGIVNTAGNVDAVTNVIIPPAGGHGADIYNELGARKVMIYARLENDVSNPDFITGNEFARIGVVKDPLIYGSSSKMSSEKASAVYALKVKSDQLDQVTFVEDDVITQNIGVGSTAIGRVVSFDNTTGVLKYWQDNQVATSSTVGVNPLYGYKLLRFQNALTDGGSFNIAGGNATVAIETSFSGISTVLNNRTYFLGQTFDKGTANPEVNPQSGQIIYVDNRPSVTRSSNQKEDIKIVLEF